ncbi:ABC transporter substrate-binding protein [Geomesophilobacter sediminis]|uniref:ABC transporter substrate-binding protein n=1 Tax=Geomesophilobacter sediminis TaxID=2798584 RepID=A0A8J7M0X4_9BACT|nr:ABC transporter substrate-binding protein [Geomesophilobacter sediminis]MBJ6726541.1 ABC transporter substrate-binding protein [Geomesophilobacter sediminis]
MKRIALMVVLLLAVAAVASAENVIKIGMVNDQTGPNKGAGIAMKAGVAAYFKAVNERGGVNGAKLELVVANDQYDPDKTVDGVLKLIEEQKIFAVVGTIGTSNGISILPIVKEQKLPFVSPRSGALNFRTPVIPEVINIRASHQEEIDRLVDLLAKEGGAKRFAVFYQNDTFGTEILSCTETALKRHGLSLAAKGSFQRGTLAVASALSSIIQGKPDAIILGSVYAPGAEFAKAARKEGLKSYFASGSFAGGANLVKAAGADAEGMIFSQVVPPLSDLSLPITKECKEAVEKNPEGAGFNSVSLEGCITAKSMVLALEKAGTPPTRDGFIKAFEAMKGTDLGGIKLSFAPDNHQGQNNVYMEMVKDGKLVPFTALK